jgi:hypothetical protein
MSTSSIISEQFVQEIIADDFDKYHFKSNNAGFVDIEVYTKEKKREKSKRADILFAFRRTKKGIYTVVIEAKSRKTLGNLKPKDSFKKQVNIARILALVIYISGVFYFWEQLYFGFGAIGILLVSFVASIMILRKLVSYWEVASALSVPAIEQLDKYPGNEKWLAIASDTFVNEEDFKSLRKYCKQARIGLIIVDEYGSISIELMAKPTEEINQYIDFYMKGDEIKSYLKRKRKFTTPAEKAKTNYQLKYGYASLAIILFFLFVFEYSPNRSNKGEKFNEFSLYSVPNKKNKTKEQKTLENLKSNSEEKIIKTNHCVEFKGKIDSFIVVESLCRSELEAMDRIEELKRSGLTQFKYTNSFCLNLCENQTEFTVFFPTFYSNLESAKKRVKKIKNYAIDRNMKVKDFEPLQIKK